MKIFEVLLGVVEKKKRHQGSTYKQWKSRCYINKVVPSAFHSPTFSSHWISILLDDSDDPKNHIQII